VPKGKKKKGNRSRKCDEPQQRIPPVQSCGIGKNWEGGISKGASGRKRKSWKKDVSEFCPIKRSQEGAEKRGKKLPRGKEKGELTEGGFSQKEEERGRTLNLAEGQR